MQFHISDTTDTLRYGQSDQNWYEKHAPPPFLSLCDTMYDYEKVILYFFLKCKNQSHFLPKAQSVHCIRHQLQHIIHKPTDKYKIYTKERAQTDVMST